MRIFFVKSISNENFIFPRSVFIHRGRINSTSSYASFTLSIGNLGGRFEVNFRFRC